MKEKKDNVLLAIQEGVPLTYDVVKDVYKITGSYDSILELNKIALEYNKNIVQLALFLYQD